MSPGGKLQITAQLELGFSQLISSHWMLTWASKWVEVKDSKGDSAAGLPITRHLSSSVISENMLYFLP